MANYWVFRDGQTNKLEHHDIGSATLKDFLAANPSLGPVRRGTVADPTYIAPTSYGGNVEAPVVEQSDPTSAEPAFKSTKPPAELPSANFGGGGGPEFVYSPQTIGLNPEDMPGVEYADPGPRPDSLGIGGLTPEQLGEGFFNPDAFSPENRYGFDYEVDPETGVATKVDRSGLFGDDSEVAGGIQTVLEAVSPAITPNQQAALQEFLDAMGGPLFDENGNPIFPNYRWKFFPNF